MYIYPYVPQWPLRPLCDSSMHCTQTSDLTHPVISLMTHTGHDIEWVIRVTSALLRGVNIKLIKSNIGPIAEEQWQYLLGHKSYH